MVTQLLDVDAHEMVPSHLWGREFGENGAALAAMTQSFFSRNGGNNFVNPSLSGDEAPIDEETVWSVRGTDAPGAFDFRRRLSVMDVMGTHRQLVFPSFGLAAAMLVIGGELLQRHHFGIQEPTEKVDAIARGALAEYNEWAVRTTALDPDRLRAVALLLPHGSVDELVDEARSFIDRGIRAICLPAASPPGGLSPAAPELDPFWAMLAERDVPLVMHVSGEWGFVASPMWGKAPAFKPGKVVSAEVGIEPYSQSTLHVAFTNYLTVLVLGGVFERHPRLRVGVLECGAHWLPGLATNLDMWATKNFKARLAEFISLLPSEYLARNVRVTPYVFEDVDRYIKQAPNLSDCYCYSTDYPHQEGGKYALRTFEEKILPLGDEAAEKFFVTNGRLLLPA